MAKQATYGNYVVTVEDNGSVNVTKSGALCDNTNAALKEIAEQIGFAVDPKWNCRQLGPKILKEISGGKAPSPKTPAAAKQENAEVKSNTNSSSKELETALARIAELEAENKKLKAELEQIKQPEIHSEASNPTQTINQEPKYDEVITFSQPSNEYSTYSQCAYQYAFRFKDNFDSISLERKKTKVEYYSDHTIASSKVIDSFASIKSWSKKGLHPIKIEKFGRGDNAVMIIHYSDGNRVKYPFTVNRFDIK